MNNKNLFFIFSIFSTIIFSNSFPDCTEMDVDGYAVSGFLNTGSLPIIEGTQDALILQHYYSIFWDMDRGDIILTYNPNYDSYQVRQTAYKVLRNMLLNKGVLDNPKFHIACVYPIQR